MVAAAIPLTPALRARFLATRPYFRWPGRFVARTDRGLPAPSAAALAGRSVGVVAGSAHAAYRAAFFPGQLDWLEVGASVVVTGIVLVIGFAVFRRSEHRVLKEL